MKKIAAILLCLLLILSGVAVTGATYDEIKEVQTQEKKTYIVVLDAPAVYSPDRVTFYGSDDNTYREALLELQAEVRSQINGGVSVFSLRNSEKTYSYTDVLNGFTVNVDAATAESIRKIDGVKGVYENEMLTMITPIDEEFSDDSSSTEESTTQETEPLDTRTGNMMNAQVAYDKGYDGEGRAIAVLDTAILPDHNYYKLTDESTVRYTYDDIETIIKDKGLQVKNATAQNAYYNSKVPFAYNYAEDSDDFSSLSNHGAHVAGIAAGAKTLINNQFYISGIAPEAQILFFGVFDETTGMAPADTVLAAMEDAVKFDIDAINLSLGVPYRSENNGGMEPFNEAVVNAENAGISVIYAAGNTDKGDCLKTTEIDYSTADNRSYLTTSKVGSVQGEYVNFVYLEDNLGNKYKCVSHGADTALDLTDFVYCYGGTTDAFNTVDVLDKVAFIVMPHKIDSPAGIGTYYARAKNAGAAAVVIAINTNNDLSYGSISSASCPVFTVTKATGQRILNSEATGLKFANKKEILKSDESGCTSDYSAYGYADNLDISIDFAAPGGNILSSVLSKDGYTYKSGTSMATPHVTGATALMHQYVEAKFPAYTGAAKVRLIKKLLASTAKTVYEQNGALASPRKVGSGLIDLAAAMNTSVYLTGVDSDYTRINLGADLTDSFTVNFEVHNLSDVEVTFNSMTVDLSSDDYYAAESGMAFEGLKKLTATGTGNGSVTVPANGKTTASINVTISNEDIEYLSTAMTNGFFVDGKVTLTSETNCDVGIPFSGFYGDWSRLPIMDSSQVLSDLRVVLATDDGVIIGAIPQAADSDYVLPVSATPDDELKDYELYTLTTTKRNANLKISVDDEVVYEGFTNKEYGLYHAMENTFVSTLAQKVKEGNSKITVEFTLPYYEDSSKSQTVVLNLTEDSEKPVISDAYVTMYNSKDSTFVIGSDNVALARSVCRYKNSDGEQKVSYTAALEKASVRAYYAIDGKTEMNYTLYDAAFNAARLPWEISIDVADGTATYTNNTHNSLSGVCMIVVYDENNKMTDWKMLDEAEVTIAGYDTKTFDVSAYADEYYKLFFWKDVTSTYEPICDAYVK